MHTYEGAHNPPNDLYVIRFSVEPPGDGEAIEKAKFIMINVKKPKYTIIGNIKNRQKIK
ncbi:hypothetical protein ACQKM9_03805 [Viridibacillus sp. NPDC093762]|uniref:hypothetical protein n=1 Tax=Viridibacillus sp. NPDC093762 TaxID=3390720 RepID=UPI003D00F346